MLRYFVVPIHLRGTGQKAACASGTRIEDSPAIGLIWLADFRLGERQKWGPLSVTACAVVIMPARADNGQERSFEAKLNSNQDRLGSLHGSGANPGGIHGFFRSMDLMRFRKDAGPKFG